MTQQKEPLIIDMRTATSSDLLVLAKLLTTINTLLSCHGFSIQVRKTRQTTSSLSKQVTLS